MRWGRAIAATATLGALWFAACHLNIDDSLLGKAKDGGKGGSGGTTVLQDSSFGGGYNKPDANTCDADPQCLLDGSCFEGHCLSGKCAYALCPTTDICTKRDCVADGSKCDNPSAVGFLASSIDLGVVVGCGGSAPLCIAAFDDIVVVGTNDGKLNAWRTTSPATPEPLAVPKPSFDVLALVATRHRVLAVGTPSATGVDVAWLDPPTDTTSNAVVLTAGHLTSTQTFDSAYPSDNDQIFFVRQDASAGFPTAIVTETDGGGALSGHATVALATGTRVVASSATRLVTMLVDPAATTLQPTFKLISGAGTATAAAGADQKLSFEVPPNPEAHAFVSGYDGTVYWSTNHVYRDTNNNPMTNAVVVRRLLASGATTFDTSFQLDVSSYADTDATVVRAGGIAMIDSDHVVVATTSPADNSQTAIQVVQNAGGFDRFGRRRCQ
jgi:hypothetical protein